jgi:hypothetical protein
MLEFGVSTKIVSLRACRQAELTNAAVDNPIGQGCPMGAPFSD